MGEIRIACHCHPVTELYRALARLERLYEEEPRLRHVHIDVSGQSAVPDPGDGTDPPT